MIAEATARGAPVASLWGEFRYGGELARLLLHPDVYRALNRALDAPREAAWNG